MRLKKKLPFFGDIFLVDIASHDKYNILTLLAFIGYFGAEENERGDGCVGVYYSPATPGTLLT